MLLYLAINLGIGGSILTMLKFSKYCRLLNKSWTLDPETLQFYQAKARHYLAATGVLLLTAFGAVFLSAIFSG